MNTSWLHIIGIGPPLRRHLPKCNKAAVKSGRKQSQRPLVDGWRGSCPAPEKNAIKSSITLAEECRMGSNFVSFFSVCPPSFLYLLHRNRRCQKDVAVGRNTVGLFGKRSQIG